MYRYRIFAFSILIVGILLAKLLENSHINEILIAIINFIFAVTFFIINRLSDRGCELAATIQEYIDRRLFNFKIEKNMIDKFNIKEIEQKIYETVRRYSKEHKIQIEKTGEDPEHGVKDWYSNISSNLEMKEAISKCQKQNTWWDVEQDKIYNVFKIIFAILLGLIIVIFFKNMWQIIVITILSILLELYTLCSKYKVYKNISQEIKTLEDVFEKSEIKDMEILKEIQNKIFERRKTGYKVPDFIHNFKSSELHEKYKKYLNRKEEIKCIIKIEI